MFKRWLIALLLLCWNCHGVDYDVAVIGTSPIAMFEALYHHYSGERVVILEKDSVCGGSWKSIDICGIPHADMGCHSMSSDPFLHDFLTDYAGCHMVSLDNPSVAYSSMGNTLGFYPSRGCYELVNHLEQMVKKAGIPLQFNCCLERIVIDEETLSAQAHTNWGTFTVSKVLATHYSDFAIEQSRLGYSMERTGKATFYHLYLLLEDPGPSRFSYKGTNINGSSRMMNLTRFTGLEGTGKQLVVFQVYAQPMIENAGSFLEQLRQQQLVSDTASLIQADFYNYEQSFFPHQSHAQVDYANKIIEVMQTGAFSSMSSYLQKWRQVLPTYQQIMCSGE